MWTFLKNHNSNEQDHGGKHCVPNDFLVKESSWSLHNSRLGLQNLKCNIHIVPTSCLSAMESLISPGSIRSNTLQAPNSIPSGVAHRGRDGRRATRKGYGHMWVWAFFLPFPSPSLTDFFPFPSLLLILVVFTSFYFNFLFIFKFMIF